jgi:endonuclease-3 related protein
MSRAKLADACRRLIGMYDVDGWWPARSRFEVMAGAVLVQNTRWPNAAAALRALRSHRLLRPAAISTSKPADLTALISPAGCQRVKARRLRALARWVEREGGLRSLANRDTDALRAGLLGVHGVGPETADAILCFAFGRPRFVADKYARTWLARMGLAAARDVATYEACRAFVENGLERADIGFDELHAAIVSHAQAVCGARPACRRCAFGAACPTARGGLLRVDTVA